jgi:hypothetical protein
LDTIRKSRKNRRKEKTAAVLQADLDKKVTETQPIMRFDGLMARINALNKPFTSFIIYHVTVFSY